MRKSTKNAAVLTSQPVGFGGAGAPLLRRLPGRPRREVRRILRWSEDAPSSGPAPAMEEPLQATPFSSRLGDAILSRDSPEGAWGSTDIS